MHIKLSQRAKDFLYSWWNRFMFLEIVLYFTPCTLSFPIDSQLHLFADFTGYLYYPWWYLARWIIGAHSSVAIVELIEESDTPFQYFQWIASVILFAVIALIWSWIWRKDSHQKLDSILVWVWKNVLRIELAILMIWYGMIKAIPAQMHNLDPYVLSQPVGDQSAHDYLWNFMSFSPIFESMVGVGELLGGILLLIPRFACLGGYLSLSIMIPTALMNIFYSVGVVILSTQICLGEIILLWSSIIGLGKYFLLHKDLKAKVPERIFWTPKVKLHRFLMTTYVALSILFTFGCVQSSLELYHNQQLDRQISMNGRWRITSEVVYDHRFDPLGIPGWSKLDFAAKNQKDWPGFFRVEPDIWTFYVFYDTKHIVLPTQDAKVLPFDTDINYHVSGDILTLTSQSPDRYKPAFSITAKRQVWAHNPGEFHLFPD